MRDIGLIIFLANYNCDIEPTKKWWHTIKPDYNLIKVHLVCLFTILIYPFKLYESS